MVEQCKPKAKGQICPTCGCSVAGGGYVKDGVTYCCEPCSGGIAGTCECGCCHPVNEKPNAKSQTSPGR